MKARNPALRDAVNFSECTSYQNLAIWLNSHAPNMANSAQIGDPGRSWVKARVEAAVLLGGESSAEDQRAYYEPCPLAYRAKR